MTTCPNCQSPIPDGAQFCPRCGMANPAFGQQAPHDGFAGTPHTPPPHAGAYGHGGAVGPEIPNYLVQSILVTIFTLCTCCIPIGVIPLIFSFQVNSKKQAGDFAGAAEASRKAKMWCWITFGVALVWFAISMAFGIMSALIGMAGGVGGLESV